MANATARRRAVAFVGCCVAESCADGVINEEQVEVVVPRVRHVLNLHLFVDTYRSEFVEHAKERRGARATLQPNERLGCGGRRLVLSGVEPHVHVRLVGCRCVCDVEESRV